MYILFDAANNMLNTILPQMGRRCMESRAVLDTLVPVFLICAITVPDGLRVGTTERCAPCGGAVRTASWYRGATPVARRWNRSTFRC